MAQIVICAGISYSSYMRPVGAFQIANVLRQQGYTVQVIDSWPFIAARGKEMVKSLLGHFTNKDTLWIGFSSTWFKRLKGDNKNAGIVYKDTDDLLDNTFLFDDEDLEDIKKYLLDKSPNLKFVLGGGRAPIGRLGHRPNFIDCYIEGYADKTVVEYTNYLKGKNPFLPVHKNPDGSISIIHDHKASTFDYNNHRFSWHKNDLVRKGEALPMEIARGCIFNCSFCAYPLNGRKKLDYLKNSSILLEQLEENYSRYETTHYWFLDDTFNDSPEKLEILYNEVFSKLSFKINFNAFMRLDLLAAHPHTIDILKESGCGGYSFGIESLNYQALKSIGKGIKKEKIYDTLVSIKEKQPDVLIDSQFIIGLPYETKETVKEWITEIIDPAYPLENAKIHLLAFNPFKQVPNIWVSNFETYPEKYGYTFLHGTNTAWVNNMGFSIVDAIKLKNQLEDLMSKKEGDAWLGYAGFINVGLSEVEARNRIKFNRNTLQRSTDYDLRKKHTSNYIDLLFRTDPQF